MASPTVKNSTAPKSKAKRQERIDPYAERDMPEEDGDLDQMELRRLIQEQAKPRLSPEEIARAMDENDPRARFPADAKRAPNDLFMKGNIPFDYSVSPEPGVDPRAIIREFLNSKGVRM